MNTVEAGTITIYALRHGQYQGEDDGGLTKEGYTQAAQASQCLKSRIDPETEVVVLTSDKPRSIQTGSVIAETLGGTPSVNHCWLSRSIFSVVELVDRLTEAGIQGGVVVLAGHNESVSSLLGLHDPVGFCTGTLAHCRVYSFKLDLQARRLQAKAA